MKNSIKILALGSIILLTVFCCDKKNPQPDPNIAFWGKWNLIGSGNGPQVDYYTSPSSYWEFKSDSSLLIYSYTDEETHIVKYWVDTLLYLAPLGEEIPSIGIFRYQFNGDTMRLDNVFSFAMVNTHVFKKTK